MTVQFGINITQNGSDRPVGTLGPWRRIVVSDPRAPEIVRGIQQGGNLVLAIATKQVIWDLGNDPATTPRRFFDRFGFVEGVQVWNEPDGSGDESDVIHRNVYQQWLWSFRDEARRRRWPGTLVAAGLVSGNPDYLRGLDMTGGYKLAIHPYDQRPYSGFLDWGWGDLPALLDAYRPYLPAGTGFWLTECSRTTRAEAVQANYADALVRALAPRTDVETAMWYCWQDWMLGETYRPFGLIRADSSVKPTHFAWANAVRDVSVGAPMVPGPPAGGGNADARVAQLETQQSLQSDALAQLLANHYADGPQSAKGKLVQLDNTKYRDLEVVEMTPKP